jgi:N-acyl-phosphatidylethanolamine-hydrolysing phospholipase D
VPGSAPIRHRLAGWRTGIGGAGPGAPPHHRPGGFVNLNPIYQPHGAWTRIRFLASRHWASLTDPPSVDLPRVANDGRALREVRREATITWIGHSTFLVQLDGVNILTDPHWSARASPVSFAGPRRLTEPGLRFESLPPVHVVVISHDHYDHLDAPTVARLAATHRPLFLVPLGFRSWFAGLGVTPVEELDWWEGRVHHGLTFTCLPVQHWCGRSLWDTNRRLWSGWAVAGASRRLFFAGDTGYWDGHREIGARLGPFDLALVPIGAYLPQRIMRINHTTPEEAIRVCHDVGAGRLVAMHWGTFNLAEEPIDEPPRRLGRAARALGIDDDRVWVLPFGETRRW